MKSFPQPAPLASFPAFFFAGLGTERNFCFFAGLGTEREGAKPATQPLPQADQAEREKSKE